MTERQLFLPLVVGDVWTPFGIGWAAQGFIINTKYNAIPYGCSSLHYCGNMPRFSVDSQKHQGFLESVTQG